MGELDNCVRCDKLFVKTTSSVCPDCIKEEDKAFRIVYNYLKIRKNREAKIAQIIEETGVEEDLIMKFVKEKRLRPSQFPNLNYKCEQCGDPIQEGKICSNCASKFNTDLQHEAELEKIKQRNETEENKKARTYFSMKKD